VSAPPALLFVGGTRSGKSALALRWAEAKAPCRLFAATCRATDAETSARVARHKAERGEGWQCVENHMDPLAAIQHFFVADTTGVVVLDCVSLWIAALLSAGLTQEAALAEVSRLAGYLESPDRPTALVSIEAGTGLVPTTPLGRLFQDTLGLTNQLLAKVCSCVIFVSCGLPLPLKGGLPEELC
jgi:adenosylcobinamide kinase/adenosylcobinamide-phosphate guanylyltransferase